MYTAARDYMSRSVKDAIIQSFLSSQRLSTQEKQLVDADLRQVLRKQLDDDLKVTHKAYEPYLSEEEHRKPRLYQTWLYETMDGTAQRELIEKKLEAIRAEAQLATTAPVSGSSSINPSLAHESLTGAVTVVSNSM